MTIAEQLNYPITTHLSIKHADHINIIHNLIIDNDTQNIYENISLDNNLLHQLHTLNAIKSLTPFQYEWGFELVILKDLKIPIYTEVYCYDPHYKTTTNYIKYHKNKKAGQQPTKKNMNTIITQHENISSPK